MFSTEISINLAPNSALVPENDIFFLRGPVKHAAMENERSRIAKDAKK